MLARLSRLTTTSGGNTIQDYEYWYTQRGNVSSVIDNHSGVTYNYAYDDLHRLTSESISGGGTTMTLDYDPLGNILSKSTAGNSLVYTYGTAGKPHRLTTITQNGFAYNYAYDANGNMTTSFDLVNPANVMQRSIQYNAENMPIQIDVFPYGGGTPTSFGLAYDANGARVLKRIGGNVDTVYVGPHFEVANSVETNYIFAGSQRIARVTTSATQYFHQDHLGSATRVTDESGQLVEQAEYMPFGEMRAGSSSPPFASNYKYTDQEMDVGIGLYNYDARMYDPIVGRFISPDLHVPDPMNPQSFSRYSYVLNNPLRLIDPTGYYYVSPIGDPSSPPKISFNLVVDLSYTTQGATGGFTLGIDTDGNIAFFSHGGACGMFNLAGGGGTIALQAGIADTTLSALVSGQSQATGYTLGILTSEYTIGQGYHLLTFGLAAGNPDVKPPFFGPGLMRV